MSAQLASGGISAEAGAGGGRVALIVSADELPDLLAGGCPPVPVIAYGKLADAAADAADLIAGSAAEADRLLASISAHPRAASVLVHVLRSIPHLPVRDALTLESLAYGLLQGSAEHAHWLSYRQPVPPRPAGAVRMERVGASMTIVVDRPQSLNAIDCRMRDGLFDAFTVASCDPEIERVELRSTGRAFSVGADLSEFGTTRDPASAHDIRMRTLPAQALIGCRDRLHVHVQGACIGAGLEMAAFAQRLTASPTAWFQLPELAMGLIPGAGGCVSVTGRIGRQRAGLMILSGKRISAATALDWGLIDGIVDD